MINHFWPCLSRERLTSQGGTKYVLREAATHSSHALSLAHHCPGALSMVTLAMRILLLAMLLLSYIPIKTAFLLPLSQYHSRSIAALAADANSVDVNYTFDGLSCGTLMMNEFGMSKQAQRLARFAELQELAVEFIDRKNRGDLKAIFANLDPDSASIYGLTGEEIELGLTDFFKKHINLQHKIIDEPIVSSPDTVEYRFVKSWIDSNTGEQKTWRSRDPERQRDKVERLVFGKDSQLLSVDVVSIMPTNC